MHDIFRTDFPVVFIQSNDDLVSAALAIGRSPIISLDTEYDSFKRQYGFNMLLIQVFDLTTVYIIDPLTVTDYKALWQVFENSKIEKVLYSGSEDIALLKQHGCQIRNVFDVQVAATLSNHPARNLGDLLLAETGKTIDKSEQTSDWSVRPLSPAKIEYAANDVIFLPAIRNKLKEEISHRKLEHILQQENEALENILERKHIPKLKPSYFREFSKSYCDTLLELLNYRDQIGKEHNIPPNRVVDTRFLEEAMNNRDEFLKNGEFKSFHPKVRHSRQHKDKFISVLNTYDPLSTELYPRQKSGNRRIISKDERLKILETYYEPVKLSYINQYGERAAEFLLRGMKRRLTSGETNTEDLLPYQIEIYEALKEKLED